MNKQYLANWLLRAAPPDMPPLAAPAHAAAHGIRARGIRQSPRRSHRAPPGRHRILRRILTRWE
jgi:hypothetical protein